MGLSDFFTALGHELRFLKPRYRVQRLEHPVLASYRSIGALLRETEPREEGKKRVVTPEGAAILCALLERYQATKGRLWGAILLRAFRPMLCGVGKRLIGGSSDDRASVLLAVFHDATLHVDPRHDPRRIAMYVRQETRRSVFRELRKELDWQDTWSDHDVDACPDPTTCEPPALRGQLPRRGRKKEPSTELMATLAERGSLWEFVRGKYSGLPTEEQARVYRKLQQRRRRHAGWLRQAVARDLRDTATGTTTARPNEENPGRDDLLEPPLLGDTSPSPRPEPTATAEREHELELPNLPFHDAVVLFPEVTS